MHKVTLVHRSLLQLTFPALMMSGEDTMLSKRLHSIQIGGKKSEDVEERHFRLSVMGASCVGKSAIISQFLYDTFSSDYHETVEDLHRKVVDLNGRKVILDILDTAGTHEFPAMRKLAIATSDAFVLVYSVDNDASFDEVKLLREQIIEERNDVPIVIVGNKADVCEQTRIMEHETAETIACVEWGCGYVEASAKQNLNIPQIFAEMLRLSDVPCLTLPEGQRTKRKRLLSAPLPTIHHVFETPKGPKRNSCAVS
ncbi:ras-related protein Rap-1-like [Ylistrum balloti]|uniref:ras-related protein Rap-1-like n=1 Tax=Ylistrum balloti TaxID=509963 RepID=UPI002905AECA|nr:ras-related protein Rap-1-like [Ylistrum balloti]